MVVVATDAPLDSRNLKRLAKRAMLGIVRTGGYFSNGSGDFGIAFSTSEKVRIPHSTRSDTLTMELLRNSRMSALFLAAAEACEEAILNSLFKAKTMQGRDGRKIEALPLDKIKAILEEAPKK
jgi:D-aminopeptidase